MDHSGLIPRFNSPLTTFNIIKKMNLTPDQRLALAQRIADEFNFFLKEELAYQVDDMEDNDDSYYLTPSFVKEELAYQVDVMKDNEELDHSYYVTPSDQKDITKLVIDLIAVPVA